MHWLEDDVIKNMLIYYAERYQQQILREARLRLNAHQFELGIVKLLLILKEDTKRYETIIPREDLHIPLENRCKRFTVLDHRIRKLLTTVSMEQCF
jgi:hypothetical protein